jgi:acetyltransferase-like isoleucine patch superfamily enzyme
MLKKLAQLAAFFCPSPINVWLHRAAGAQIDEYVSIHPCVLILAKKIEIGRGAHIKFGTMINARTFKLGRKSSIGFFTLVNGESDLIVGDASIIGPRTMINCSRPVVIGYYSGIGPNSCLYTHGSGLPVTEGYRATFAPIHIKDKVWVSMRSTIGPGVTIEEGAIVMPGTVLIESIAPKRMVAGNPAKLANYPVFLRPVKPGFVEDLAPRILEEYRNWSNEYKGTNWQMIDGALVAEYKKKKFTISVEEKGDIVVLTTPGKKTNGMYFNLVDLKTDNSMHKAKINFEAYIRLYYGLIFL